MENQLENYNNQIQWLEKQIADIQNMDSSAADNVEDLNQRLVSYQNELAELTRQRDEFVARQDSQQDNTPTKRKQLEEELNRRQNEILHLNNIISELGNARGILSEEEYNRSREQIGGFIERENNELANNIRIANAYDSMLENIRKLNELDGLAQQNNQTEEQILEERERREEEIKQARKLLPEDYQEEIRNIILKENQKEDNKDKQKINILDEKFNPYTMNFDEFTKLYHHAIVENQDNEAVIIQLNSLYNEVKDKRKKAKDNPNYAKDSNGNVMFFLDTSIPHPRQQKWDETTEDYHKFLNEEYGPLLENENYFKNKEDKQNFILSLPKNPNVPLIPLKTGKDDSNVLKPLLETPKKPRKTLQQIMYNLQHDLEIKAKSGQRYQAANLKVAKNFRNELKSGNVWYNVVHFAPAVLKSAIAGVKKVFGKFNLWRTEQKPQLEQLQERINNLSADDLQVIWEEYRGTQVNQDSFTSTLNMMLNERVQQFTREKVAEINNQIAIGYNKMFADHRLIQQIDERMKTANIKDEEKANLQAQKDSLLAGKAQEIKKLRELYIQGNNYYSGGAHGFSEDMKAAGTNLSKVGKRFAKRHDYDDELQREKARTEMIEAQAISQNNDAVALETFIYNEKLKAEKTSINSSIFGKRSTGQMYYSPLVGELDYRDDPFIRDVFTTVATVTAAVSAANAIHTHVTESNRILAEEQAKATHINKANQQTMDQVHQTGQDIANHRETFEQGMKAQANSDVINTLNVGERNASNQSINAGGGWSYGSVYTPEDELAHATAKQAYETSQQQIEDIAAKYTQGLLSESEVTQAFASMATQTNQTLENAIQSALPHFQTYMQSHPQFELSEVGKAMNYLVQNPSAIPQMYQGMVDVTNMGENLTGLTMEQVSALQSLPSDMQTTLLGAVSSAALAYNCAKSTSHNRSSAKTSQEQELINMVNQYQTRENSENTNQNSR